MVSSTKDAINNLVSVIVPVFNGEKYLAQAIESILAQTYENIEVIVVDDGSTDRSMDIIHSFPGVKYFFQKNKGVAAARNLGIQKAKGEYISFLDADDIWLPNKLKDQIKALINDPSIDMVTGFVEQFLSPEVNGETKKEFASRPTMIKGYSTTAMLVHRSFFKKAGMFPEGDFEGETIRWFAGVLTKDFNIIILPGVVTKRRIHGRNISITNREKKNKKIVGILRESIDLKRSMKR